MTFGDQLKRLREEKAISQEELAAGLDVSQACVCAWEEGEAIPDASNLSKLIAILGTDLFFKEEQVQCYLSKQEREDYFFNKNEKIIIGGIKLFILSVLLTGVYQALENYADNPFHAISIEYLHDYPLKITLYMSLFLIVLGIGRIWYERSK